MKNAFFSSFFVLVSLFAGSQAFAQGITGLMFLDGTGRGHSSSEAARAADRVRADLYGSIGTGSLNGGNVLVMPAQRQPVYVQQQFIAVQNSPGHFTSGGNTYNCSTARSVIGAGIGAIVGYYAGKGITVEGGTLSGGGAIAGGLIGSQIACEMVQGTQQTLVNQGSQPGTVVHPSKCSVIGNPKLQNLPLTEEQCKEMAGTQTVTVPGSTVAVAVGPETDQNWQWRETSSVTSPGKCVVEKILEGVQNPPFCAIMKPLPRNPGEGRKTWAVRAAQS